MVYTRARLACALRPAPWARSRPEVVARAAKAATRIIVRHCVEQSAAKARLKVRVVLSDNVGERDGGISNERVALLLLRSRAIRLRLLLALLALRAAELLLETDLDCRRHEVMLGNLLQ